MDLGTLPGDRTSQAVAILDGTMQGGGQILGLSGHTPVVWSESGSISALPIPPIPASDFIYPDGFNERGDVVGSDVGGSLLQHGWIWSATDGKYDLSGNVQGGSNEGNAGAVNASGLGSNAS